VCRYQVESEGGVKTFPDLLDDWDNGTLTDEGVKQLKSLLGDPQVRSQLRQEISFFGLLKEVLKDETALDTQAVAKPAADLAGFEREFASAAAKFRTLLASFLRRLARPAVAWALVAILLVSSSATYYFWPRPLAYFSDPGQGTGIDHGGKVLRAVAGGKIYSGDSVNVPYIGSVGIQFVGERTSLYLGPQTDIELLRTSKGKVVKIALGQITAKIAAQPANRPFRVATSNATITVKGTAFTLRVWTNGCYVAVAEGAVELREVGKTPIIVLPSHYAVTGTRAPLKSDWVYGIKREAWVAGTAPLAKDVPASAASFVFEDYAYRAQTFMWEYPFLADRSKRYRERLVGYFKAPETADYTFWMMSEAASELWFSPSGFETNKILIASTPAPTPGAKLTPTWNYILTPGAPQSPPPSEPYNKFPSQKSPPQHLEQGKLYYIEALHEAAPEDAMTIVWALPGSAVPVDAIPGQNLMPLMRQ
jgi:FecR-like protein